MDEIILHFIGKIISPYKNSQELPIQAKFNLDAEAYIELKKEYADGLKDLDKFSHAIILYFFHKSGREDIIGTPFLEEKKHGIFAIRSPHRPNHLGFSVVKINRIEDNKLYFRGVDMLDNTPVIDIKPYISYFDSPDDTECGWLEKHFKDGVIK